VNLRHVSLVLFVLTLALMLPFEYTVTRALGVACLVGFVVTGWFAIATPAYLEHAEEEEPPAAD
jgi:hypothetical protein